jgi:hypothetical protein
MRATRLCKVRVSCRCVHVKFEFPAGAKFEFPVSRSEGLRLGEFLPRLESWSRVASM